MIFRALAKLAPKRHESKREQARDIYSDSKARQVGDIIVVSLNENTSADNHDGVITHLEPDILKCEVKWVLESITMNKASGGDGIPVELFQILDNDAVKVLHSICQHIWKTQQWPQD